MPFITEELWHALYGGKPALKSIALAAFPQHDDALISENLETEMSVLQDLIVSVRQIRHDLKIEPKVSAPIRVFADDGVRRLIEGNREAVERMANVSAITFVDSELSKVAGARHTARFDVVVEYEKKVDATAERARLEKELLQLRKQQDVAARQLGNQHFLTKAPSHVVEGLRRQLAEYNTLVEKKETQPKSLAQKVPPLRGPEFLLTPSQGLRPGLNSMPPLPRLARRDISDLAEAVIFRVIAINAIIIAADG